MVQPEIRQDLSGRGFAARLDRCPIPYDLAAAADLPPLLSHIQSDLLSLVQGAAGCSPYLHGLMKAEAVWLAEVLSGGPEAGLNGVLAPLPEVAPDALAAALRLAKRRIALLVALADLGGVWGLEEVTGALTRFADLAVTLGVQRLVADEIRRGKLPGAVAGDEVRGAGMFVLAMGKMGAAELNYSSDIDLICLFDDSRYRGAEVEARAAFVRVTRRLTGLLSDQTAGGYVFRTDLRLRPDAAVTPVCLSASAAEDYYESLGRTWERAAYIKARPCAGDLVAGDAFLAVLRPFVWRKHLDFAAIQDAHDMRLRIRDHRGLHGPISLPGHNMKLGAGGIREIEFFTQTRQIIAGGRDPGLRLRGTVPALAALAEKGWVGAEDAGLLTGHYRVFREVEHRVQMTNDVQTHDLPATPSGMDRLARMMGHGDTLQFCAGLQARLGETDGLTEGFFAPRAAAAAPMLPAASLAIVDGWRAYPALRSARAVEIFRRVQPKLLSRLAKAAQPEMAIREFDSFLKGLPAGVQVLSLFDANPQLVDLIVDIAASAPNLARYLSRNAGVFDAVIGGSFFAPWPGADRLTEELTALVAVVGDYEGKLDALRRAVKEWHFRIGVHHLRGLADGFAASAQYADLASAAVATVWPVVVGEFGGRHGDLPGNGAVVLAMGSLGAGRLNALSDLDLIVIYDPGQADLSQGPRPLASRPYYARLTQALVTALTAPMAEGRLYEVDMRLRPSGRQGPVATTLQAFCDYQLTEAWTWEHLALTRARVIAGNAALAAEVERFRQALLADKGRGSGILQDVRDMRDRLHVAKPATGPWDVKPLRGGLMDIELLAETTALLSGDPARDVGAQLDAGVTRGWISPSQRARLGVAQALCWQVNMAARLLGLVDPSAAGSGAIRFVAKTTGATGMAELEAALVQHAAGADEIVTALLAGGGGKTE